MPLALLRPMAALIVACLALASVPATFGRAADLPAPPSITMTVDKTVITTATGGARARVGVSGAWNGWSVEVRDETGQVHALGSQGASLRLESIGLSPPSLQSRTYTAYLKRSGTERAAASVTISNAGYVGTASVNVSQQQGAPGTTVTVSAGASDPLGRYLLSLYDERGKLISYGGSGYWPRTASVRLSTTTNTFTAYVATTAPWDHPPANPAAVGSAWITGLAADQHAEGMPLAGMLAAVAKRYPDELTRCVRAGEIATKSSTGSVPDVTHACLAGGLPAVVKLVTETLGAAATGALMFQLASGSDAADPASPDTPTEEPTPAPARTTPEPPDPVSQRVLVNRVRDGILRRIRLARPSQDSLPLGQEATAADLAAQSCLNQVLTYGKVAISECERHTILLVGDDAGQARDNDRYSIATGSPWRLNYVSGANNRLPQGWYRNVGYLCDGAAPAGMHCDEYPFRSTNQSGPNNPLTGGRTPSLAWVPAAENEAEGRAISSMVLGCGLHSGFRPVPVIVPPELGSPYLVVIAPFGTMSKSTHIC